MVEPIAIIGSGCRFPGGANTPSKLWSLIHNPRDLSRKPSDSRYNVDSFYHPVGTHHGTTNAPKSYWLDDSDESNVAKFDAGFFNIQPGEVDAMDPQQRLLMEVVYDGLCAAGQPMEKLRGSDTAVYVGMMCDDYNTIIHRDWENLPRYAATGLERGIVSNRVSYFFDWHGPSMTISTACSSSLVALDDAVQILRSGKSKMAVAAGTSLLLSPTMHIAESNLGMLSPNGRCAMWDTAADGYARGEGVAAVLVKTLSQALADGDPIECIIRETAVNQDGRGPGLTMPNNVAQAALIRDCYARAGLDPINNLQDRPQFFHAHGTGTQAGDPQEAQAISTALFPAGSYAAQEANKMLVGSIKTVIGHTEGTAGVASVIGTSLALRHGIVPPNMHFRNLNPKVAPFFEHLEIPTVPTEWSLGESQVRRASVNSFGFGGTNAHCILEEYVPSVHAATLLAKKSSSLLFSPLTFSATSETALRSMLSSHLDYLKANPTVDIASLAYTLQHRRSTLAYRKAIAASTTQDAIKSLESIVSPPSGSKDDADLSTRFSTPSRPTKVLGIFTGQGAQWPRMGAQLIESSAFAESRIADLDASLQSLPNASDRPAWTLKDQLLAGKETSRIAEAALSQPLCTAVQVVLVDILRAAGISFAAVVGHSSGEIGAAYAAGLVSAQDAIRIAYFRGVHAKLASSPQPHAPRGAMMAVGSSAEEMRTFCEERFAGRMQLAAVNSGSSVTLSGDEDAVDEAEQIFKAQGTFARKLKVDTAYHSAHMGSCAKPYLASMESCGIQPTRPPKDSTTTWFSSVYEGEPMTKAKLSNQYWVDNMCNAVLFAGALANAMQEIDAFDLAIEVGPHPALKGPAMATIDAFQPGSSFPYTGLLSRGLNDVEQLSTALGYVWSRLGSNSVRFSAVETMLSGNESRTVLGDLPPYPFEHGRSFWVGSRIANHFKHRRAVDLPNPVLGTACSEATTPGEFQWRNILRPSEMTWLKGHSLQGQTLFPATGYVSMAVEAIRVLALDANPDATIRLLKVTDVEIPRAMAFGDDAASIETIFSVSSVGTSDSTITVEWACYSVVDAAGNVALNAKGRALGNLSPAEPDTLPLVQEDSYNLVRVGDEQFYANLANIGYNYSSPFQGVSNIRRKPGYSVGSVIDQSGSAWDDNLVLHPGMLDSALQTIFAAWSFPSDTQLWTLHVPVSISAVTINPYFTALGEAGKQNAMQYETFIRSRKHSEVVGDIYLHTENGSHAFVQFEGTTLVPISRALAKNDLPMFSHFQYKVASPDGQFAAAGESLSEYEIQMYKDVDRIAYWFVRNASLSIPTRERNGLLPHFQNYLSWCDRMVDMVSRNAHPKVTAECNADSRQDIDQLVARYVGRKDVRFVQVVGDNVIPVIQAGSSMHKHMNQDGLLHAFFTLCAGPTNRWLARTISQISHRFASLNILEVGGGTGATTNAVLGALDDAYSSYTFTDVSSDFLVAAEEQFGKEASRMAFKALNMEKEPAGQGFTEGSYDVVVAMNVLYASADMETSLSNLRRLVKPGGYLLLGELTSTDLLFTGMTAGTLDGWWIGAETGRPWGPSLPSSDWDTLLKKTGFSGIDSVTPDISASLPMTVFVSQAVNDQVSLLRNPLAVTEMPLGVRNDALAIIGGTTSSVNKLGQQVSDLLLDRFHHKEFFNTIEDFASSNLAQSVPTAGAVTVLSLTDLDKPYMEEFTADKFGALQMLWATAGTLVWVTCGSREDSPHSYMMMGISRTVKQEYPNLNVQMFDLDSTTQDGSGIEPNTAHDLASTLLRQHVLDSWNTGTDSLLWTAEPEIFVNNGKQLITRLLPDSEKNERYNSQRRDVFTETNPAKETLQLVGVGQGQDRTLELQKVSPLTLADTPATKYRTIRTTHSLLQSLAVGAAGFFRLCTGVDVETNEVVLALSSSSESPANIPATLCVPLLKTPAASVLVSVAANLIAEHLLSLTPRGGTLLVNEPDSALQSALQTKAKAKSVKTVFTTAELRQHKDNTSVFLHPNFPQHVIQSTVPASAAVFAHFSRGKTSDAVRDTITKCLPPACLRISEEALLSHSVNASSEPELIMGLTQMLQKAWDDVNKVGSHAIESIALGDASHHITIGEPLAVVDWTATESVSAKVVRVDSGKLFRPDRTYFFAGMAGDVGQSLAGWMIAHGARCVVLTSRSPKVNPRFIEDMQKRYGAVVEAMSLDITSRESLRSVHAAISATLPPIGGVVNGAMILDDEFFANMTYEQFTRVLRPKVIGTQLLDELFHDDKSLDFFIVTSSISSVIGWGGQSNYAAANEFMTAVTCQRRKRGVAGSAMNIPAVLGIGVAAGEANFDFEYFQSIGHVNIGDDDLYTLFAEAVLSGRPGQADVNPQVSMGLDLIQPDLVVTDAHKRDIKFGHFMLREAQSSEKSAKAVRVKEELQTAKNQDEAYAIICDAFIANLKRMLRIAEEQKVDDSATLVEQGVDSLLAVDIRSWFLKELQVDVPTLKIFGGGSISDLVKTALEKLPDLPGASAGKSSEPAPKASPPPQPLKPNIPAHRILLAERETASSTPISTGSPIFTQANTPALSDDESISTAPPSRDELEKTDVKIETTALPNSPQESRI